MKRPQLALVLILLCLSGRLCAQTFTGTVYYQDPKGSRQELPFAQVLYVEKEQLLDCDGEGSFSLELVGDATLVATYIGYSQDTVFVKAGSPSAEFCLKGSNTLEEAVKTARQEGLSRLSSVKTEAITAAGLGKMACCTLAESFENSASISVGYSDAVTGARQIKLLGLAGTYTQMQDEKVPVMRGLSSTFGLSYVPGQWLESIQIGKGPVSAANDAGGITGQINLEHRKPLDLTPLLVNLYAGSDNMYDANIASALQLGDRWSTILLTHFSYADPKMDHNRDGFRDSPYERQINLANRWLYYVPGGVQVRFGIKIVDDDRMGGQLGYDRQMAGKYSPEAWGSLIHNSLYNGYLKVGIPLKDDASSSVAFVVSGNYYDTDGHFGCNHYSGTQSTLFANLLYHNDINEHHSVEFAFTGQFDKTYERYNIRPKGLDIIEELPIPDKREHLLGSMGEYTCRLGEGFTAIAGLRLDWDSYYEKMLASPRIILKWAPVQEAVLRASIGRALHSPSVFADNYGLLSSNRKIVGTYTNGTGAGRGLNMDLEDAVTMGVNFTYYLPFGSQDRSYVSLEAFRTDFDRQVYADTECAGNTTCIVMAQSATTTLQMDFSADFGEHFNAMLTFRYSDPRVSVPQLNACTDKNIVRPMTSLYKGVLNLQYKTHLSRWIFDFTAQLNGPMRLPDYAAKAWEMDYSPVYPMLYGQLTRRLRAMEIYAGVENITGFTQHNAIIGADNPFGSDFDASVVWGPLMGRKFYIGFRYTLWK